MFCDRKISSFANVNSVIARVCGGGTHANMPRLCGALPEAKGKGGGVMSGNSVYRNVGMCMCVFICSFILHSCITSPDEIRNDISRKNLYFIEDGYKVEINLYDYVSDDFLTSIQKRFKQCLGYAFHYPVSILSAPVDTIFSHLHSSHWENRNYRYALFLIEGKVIDIMTKRYHYIQVVQVIGDGSEERRHEKNFKEITFLQLETSGRILNVMLDEIGIFYESSVRHTASITIEEKEYHVLQKYLTTSNINKSDLFRKFSGNEEQPFTKGDTVFLAVCKTNKDWNFPVFSQDTHYSRFLCPEIRHLEKQDKTDVFDLSFWQENDNRFEFIYYIRPHKIFNSKETLLEAIKEKAEWSLSDVFFYQACN